MARLCLLWSLVYLMSPGRSIAAVGEYSWEERGSAVCPWGFESLPQRDDVLVCYQAMEPATWAGAQKACHAMGSDVLGLGSGFPLDDTRLLGLICNTVNLTLDMSSMWLSLHVIEDRLWWNRLAPEPAKKDEADLALPSIIRSEDGDTACSASEGENAVWTQGQPSVATGRCGRLQLTSQDNQQLADELHVTAWLHNCSAELPFVCWNQGMEYILQPDISGCDQGWQGSATSTYCLTEPIFHGSYTEALYICHAYPYMRAKVAKPYMGEIYAMMKEMPLQEPVWLGARVQQGIVYWEDGHMGSVDAYPWVSSGQLDSGCLAWDSESTGLEGSIRPCESKLGVVCVAKLNETEVDPPGVKMQSNDLWSSVIDIKSTNKLNLTCQAEYIHPTLPVVWMINNYLLPNGPPSAGLLLDINNELALTLAWPYPGQNYQTSLIGHYQCQVRGQIPKTIAMSDPVRLLLFDIARMTTVVVIPAREYDPSWRNERLFTGISNFDGVYINVMRELFSYVVGDRHYLPFEVIITEYSDSAHFTTTQEDYLVVYAMVAYQNYPTESSLQGSDPATLLDRWQAEVKALVSHAVDKRLAGDDHRWDNMYGHLRIKDVQMTIIDKVHDDLYCVERVTDGQDGKHLHWEEAFAGTIANSTELCVWDGLPLASCACMRGSNKDVFWGPVIFVNCTPSHTSEFTERLEDLATEEITMSNALAVSGDLRDLTSDPSALVPADVVFTAQIVENLASLNSLPVEVGDDILVTVNQAMSVDKSTMVEAQLVDNSPNRIISSLDQFASTTNLTGSNSTLLVQPQVALAVYDVSEALLTSGLAILTDSGPGFRPDDVVPLNPDGGEAGDTTLVDSAVLLPEDLMKRLKLEKEFQDELLQNTTDVAIRDDILDHPVRLSFTAFDHDALFVPPNSMTDKAPPDSRTDKAPPEWNASFVISATLHSYRLSSEGLNHPLEEPIKLIFRTDQPSDDHACVFWNFEANDGRGNWSRDGCHMTSHDDTHIFCACNHLTNFAVLVNIRQSPVDSFHHAVLGVITKVGLSLSIIGLMLTIITFIVFRKEFLFRRDPLSDTHVDKQILFYLCVALLAMYIVFLAGIERTENTTGCKVVSGLLHYLLLAAFGWMLVEGVRQFVRYYDRSHCLPEKFILKGCLVSWGIPLIIVIVISVSNSNLMVSRDFCWVHGEALYFGLLLPLGLIIVTNVVLYSMSIHRILCRRMEPHKVTNAPLVHLRISVMLFILLGITWIFGFFAIAEAQLAFQYLFCIFNSIQGFGIFWFYCVRDRRVRQSWARLCQGGPCQVCCCCGDPDTKSHSVSFIYNGSTRTIGTSVEITDLSQ